jgi:hypothetical protein
MKNTKNRHLLRKTKTEQLESESPLSKTEEEEDLKAHIKNKEEVLIDVDPKNFDKKDHIFMEFFSMYGKNFIEDKQG